MTQPTTDLGATLRLRLDLRYDGTLFHGWAKQVGLRTVQGELEDALSTILRLPISLTVAGRTDAGVHALNQVAHFDVESRETADGALSPVLRQAFGQLSNADLERFRTRVNRLLSASYSSMIRSVAEAGLFPRSVLVKGDCDVVLTGVRPVSSDFDARFSATQRSYRYEISDSAREVNPLERGRQWWLGSPLLDLHAMQSAADKAVGEHDFLSFCKPREGATTIRTLQTLNVARERNGIVSVAVSADAFCHSMVRSLVGALVEVGRGRKNPAWFSTLVTVPSRAHGVPLAPARGLTLVHVAYPEEHEWGERAKQARRRRSLASTCGEC